MTITQVVQSSGNVEKLLANLGRKRHPILGDGNCFFRALSFIVNDTIQLFELILCCLLNLIPVFSQSIVLHPESIHTFNP